MEGTCSCGAVCSQGYVRSGGHFGLTDELSEIRHLLPFHCAKYRGVELPQSILNPLTPQAAFLVPKLIAVSQRQAFQMRYK